MKKIYVTVSEMLENGVEIQPGRQIFGNIRGGKYGTFRYFYDQDCETLMLDEFNNTFKSDSVFVEIECTPIYI